MPYSLNQFVPIFDTEVKEKDDFLSPKMVSENLQVNINAIYDFIKLGLLSCEKVSVKRTARPVKLIPLRSVDNFKKCYLLRKDVQRRNLATQKLIAGPKLNNCCVQVFEIDKHLL